MPSQGDSSPGGVAFSCNRSMPLNLRHCSGTFDFNAAMDMFVFGSKTGALSFSSPLFEFDLENPIDGMEIRSVFFSSQFGIVVSLSSTWVVQVWDVFREVVGVRVKPIHQVAVPGKPRSLFVFSKSNAVFLGTESGKIFLIDLSICSTALPLPRYACTLYAEIGESVVALAGLCDGDLEYLFLGTDEGHVKVVEGRRVVASAKPFPGSGAVVSITIEGRSSGSNQTLPSCLASFASKWVGVYSGGSLVATVGVPLPALRVFGSAESLVVQLVDLSLHRLFGSKLGHEVSLLKDGVRCVALGVSAFTSLELDELESTTSLVTRSEKDGRAISWVPNLAGAPVQSVSFSRADSTIEPHLIRLCNSLTRWPPDAQGRRFTHKWNDGKWEGVVASAFSSDFQISIYSHSCQRILLTVPIELPDLSVVSAFTLTCLEKDKWSATIGFSSGKVGVMNACSAEGWSGSKLHLLAAPESVHVGARIKSVDRQLFGSNILVSVDLNGIVCFTRLDLKRGAGDVPAHVCIAGEGGRVFTDPKASFAYICMADGGVERIRTPRIRKDGSEDLFDAEVWEATTIAESVPLDGEFVALFPSIGVAVRQSGIVSLTFPRAAGGVAKIGKVCPLRSDAGTLILEAKTVIVSSHCFVVILTDSSVAAFDVAASDGSLVCVFQRSHLAEHITSIPPFFTESLHFIKWGVSITSVLFADRVKDLISGETVVGAAQRFYAFPAIQSTPLLQELQPEAQKSSEKKTHKSGFSRLFSRRKQTTDPPISDAPQFKPTEIHLQEARKQLAANLEAMGKLRDNAAEMEHASADFLKLATQLSEGEKKKTKKKFPFF